MSNQEAHADKDFEKYAYFVSKAKNYSVIMEPRVEDLLSTGERRVARDENGKEMAGLRIEFHNGMKRVEKTKENEKLIAFLREKCEKEKLQPDKDRQLVEVLRPEKVYKETEVKDLISEKDKEIERLKKMAGEGEDKADEAEDSEEADEEEDNNGEDEN